MEKIILDVEGMSCSHCENTVAGALHALPGVAKVQASAPLKKVEVEYDAAQVSPAQLKKAVADAGYDVM